MVYLWLHFSLYILIKTAFILNKDESQGITKFIKRVQSQVSINLKLLLLLHVTNHIITTTVNLAATTQFILTLEPNHYHGLSQPPGNPYFPGENPGTRKTVQFIISLFSRICIWPFIVGTTYFVVNTVLEPLSQPTE